MQFCESVSWKYQFFRDFFMVFLFLKVIAEAKISLCELKVCAELKYEWLAELQPDGNSGEI